MEEFIFRYNVFYFVVLLPISIYAVYSQDKSSNSNHFDRLLTILILVISILAVGFRGFDVGTDTPNYLRDFQFVRAADGVNETIAIVRGGGDPLFSAVTYFSSRIGNERFYLCVLSALFILPLGLFIFKNGRDKTTLLLLGFLSVYSFKWMAVNTIRSGIAIAFGLLFVYYFLHKKNRTALLFAIMALGFHLSAALLVITCVASRFFKTQQIFALLIVTSAMAIIGLGIHNIPFVAQFDRISSYIEGRSNYQVGFSATYWAYNMLISLYFLFMNRRICDQYYTRLGKMFMLLSSVYFLSFHISYSDRIGVFSWALIPIIISYPFLRYKIINSAQNSILVSILLCFQMLAIIYLKR